jgi:hypothetical protein
MRAFAASLLLPVIAAIAAEPRVPKASDGWPLLLVEEACHLGDQTMKVFDHPKPDGAELRRTFVLDKQPVPLRLYVEIWVVGLLPKGDSRVKKGWYQTVLSINGNELQVLNKLVKGKKETPELRKLVIAVSNRDVQEGENVLHVKAGAQGGNYNDFEIRRLAIHRVKPRL